LPVLANRRFATSLTDTHRFQPVLQRELLGLVVLEQPLADLNQAPESLVQSINITDE
jgi:hypothetical protein